MSKLSEHIDQLRKDIQIPDDVVKEAKARRDVVRTAAETFPDALRSFGSGSLEHRTEPVAPRPSPCPPPVIPRNHRRPPSRRRIR